MNEENVCFGIISSQERSDSSNLIQIPNYDLDYLYRKYENGTWTEEKFIPEPDETLNTSIEEQIYAESLYQTALLEIQMAGGI